MGCCPPTKVLFPSLRVLPLPCTIEGGGCHKKGFLRNLQACSSFSRSLQPFPPAFRGVCRPLPNILKQVQLPWEFQLQPKFPKNLREFVFLLVSAQSFPTFKSFSNQSFCAFVSISFMLIRFTKNLTGIFNSFFKHFHNCIGENHSSLHSTPKNFINSQTPQSRQCASCKMRSNFRNSFCYKWQSFGAMGKQRSPQTSPCLTDFLIEDLENEISTPLLFRLAFLVILQFVWGKEAIHHFHSKHFFPSRNFKADPSRIAFASLAFCPWDKFTLYS